MKIFKEFYDQTAEGLRVDRFVLSNDRGVSVELLSYGAIVSSVKLPDRESGHVDVVLGFDKLKDYEENDSYIGAMVGRYANRIAGGRFTIDKTEYQLTQNEDVNHLHGGNFGLNNRIWDALHYENDEEVGVAFTTELEDGLDGYPGTLQVCVKISLNQNNQLCFDYSAQTDRSTHVNLTHHGYFNLAGRFSGSCENHYLWIDADFYTPTDAGQIPTGEFRTVENTPLDFRTPKRLGQDNAAPLGDPEGFDNNWVLNKADGELKLIAELSDHESERRLYVSTTQPGLQCYTAQYMAVEGKGDFPGYGPRAGVALESQHFPDTPNQPNFPSTLLLPSEAYHHTTIYQFDFE